MNSYDDRALEDLSAAEIRRLQCINRNEMRRFINRSRAGWNYLDSKREPWGHSVARRAGNEELCPRHNHLWVSVEP
jgi:hypothetical protein